MNRDDIIELAKECGYWSGETVEMNDVGLERFADLIAAAEREECADIADQHASIEGIAQSIAAAIRARGEK